EDVALVRSQQLDHIHRGRAATQELRQGSREQRGADASVRSRITGQLDVGAQHRDPRGRGQADADAASGAGEVELSIYDPGGHSVAARQVTSSICKPALTATTNAIAPLNSAAMRCSHPSCATYCT